MPEREASTVSRGSLEVQLVRIEGKMDRIGDGQQAIRTDMIDIRSRLTSQSDRIGVLERRNYEEDGAQRAREAMQKTAATAVRVLWGVLVAVIVATATLVTQALGGGVTH